MRKRYCISQSGREMIGDYTLTEARKVLREMAREELVAARKRYKDAHLHKAGDSYRITLGPEKGSQGWSSLGICFLDAGE